MRGNLKNRIHLDKRAHYIEIVESIGRPMYRQRKVALLVKMTHSFCMWSPSHPPQQSRDPGGRTGVASIKDWNSRQPSHPGSRNTGTGSRDPAVPIVHSALNE